MNSLVTFFIRHAFDINISWLVLIHFLLVTFFIGVIISVRRPVGVAFAWIFIRSVTFCMTG